MREPTTWGGWGPEVRDDPFPTFAAMRDRCPVHQVRLADSTEAWLVVGHHAASAALNDRRISKDMDAAFERADAGHDTDGDDADQIVAEGLPGRAYARHMLAVDPPDHTRLRALVAPAFRASRVTALESGIRAHAEALLDELDGRGSDATVDLVAGYAHPLPFRVICDLLGVPEAIRDDLTRWFATLLSPWTGTPPPEAVAASDRITGLLEDLVDRAVDQPGDDLVGDLVSASVDGERLTRQELLSSLFQLIVAGHDTTSSLIGNGIVALLDHPDQLRALRDDPSILPGAIEELVRWTAPVPHATFRMTTEPLVLDGVEIPAHRQVLVSLGAANRDPLAIDEPDRLDLRRTGRSHLGFGHGIHFCLGAPLARAEARIALGTLLDRFPDLRLAGPRADLEWSHGDGLVLRGLAALPAVLGRRATPHQIPTPTPTPTPTHTGAPQ